MKFFSYVPDTEKPTLCELLFDSVSVLVPDSERPVVLAEDFSSVFDLDEDISMVRVFESVLS